MNREQKPNTGVLFKNDRKETDNHPDYTGTMNIDGLTYYMNAWLKSGAKGKFFSFSFKPKLAPVTATKITPKPVHKELDSEIPF